MDFDLTPDQERMIRLAVESGRISRPEDALHEAVEIWAKRERLKDDIQDLFDKFRTIDILDPTKRSAINSLFHLALGALDLDVDDDPFIAFDEWSGEMDRKAYADL